MWLNAFMQETHFICQTETAVLYCTLYMLSTTRHSYKRNCDTHRRLSSEWDEHVMAAFSTLTHWLMRQKQKPRVKSRQTTAHDWKTNTEAEPGCPLNWLLWQTHQPPAVWSRCRPHSKKHYFKTLWGNHSCPLECGNGNFSWFRSTNLFFDRRLEACLQVI